jgi:hypothetical protein
VEIIKQFLYKNNINLYIFLKKNLQNKVNFPVDIHIFLLKNLKRDSTIIEAGAADGNDTVFLGGTSQTQKFILLSLCLACTI